MLKDRAFVGLFLWGALIVGLTIFDSSRVVPAVHKADTGLSNQRDTDQQELESWTDRAVEPISLITLALVVVGVIQVRLFYWQLDLIRKSLVDAKQSADATTEAAKAGTKQAELSERALVNLERPWMFLEGAKVTRREGPQVANAWFISLKWRNAGRMPALIQQCEFRIVDKDTLPALPDYNGAVAVFCPELATVGEAITTSETGPNPQKAVKNDGAPIMYVFFGRLIYNELNGRIHRTGFALEVSPHMPAFSRYPGNAYTYYD